MATYQGHLSRKGRHTASQEGSGDTVSLALFNTNYRELTINYMENSR